jgi:glyceraldehyde 3-phosphate dehydrogenase
VESYGNDQRILDLPHPDPRMARAAALSMIPAPASAAACLGRVLPTLAGRLDVQAIRVPTPDVSLADLSVTLARDATPATVLEAFRDAAREPRLQGLLEVLEEPLVSVDLRGGTASCVLDALLTRIMAPRFVKVFAWYDNEAAHAARLLGLCALQGVRR